MRRIAWLLAIALASLSIVASIALAVFVTPTADNPGQVWTLTGWLIVPAAASLWFHGRRRRPPPGAIFLWIASLLAGLAAMVTTGSRSLDTTNPDPEFGPLIVIVVIVTQAASALWVASASPPSEQS